MTVQKIHISRFTPSLMEPETLEAIFVQREKLATDTLERICESALHDNKHYMLFIGPRGCGKTHFVSLIYHRVKALHKLDDKLRVAWLNEDKMSTSVLDLNRRIYEKLSQDYPSEFPVELLQTIYELKPAEATKYLKKLINDQLADKSALVIIENLDALFEALKTQGQHEWRSFLQESGKFCLLATAQQLFPGVSDRNQPFYGSFQTTYFKPLDVQEGTELLRNIAHQQQDHELVGFLQTPEGRSRVRALHHLSGGNHRVYVVFSEFINRQSLDELVTPFEKMLDELTPYYQERLRWLAPQQRMIVEYLCTCDRALPVKEIAKALFATSQTTSKQLKELKEKRYVRSAQRGRESLYELTEPLMRLSMELKENRGKPIQLIVHFLRVWYSREELDSRLQTLDDTDRLERIYIKSALNWMDYLQIQVMGEVLEAHAQGDHLEALNITNELIKLDGQNPFCYAAKSLTLVILDRSSEALLAANRAIELAPTNDISQMAYGLALAKSGHHQEALDQYDEILKKKPNLVFIMEQKAVKLVELKRFDAALIVFDKAIKHPSQQFKLWKLHGLTLQFIGRFAEAVESYTKWIELNPNDAGCYRWRADCLYRLGKNKEAMKSATKSMRLRRKNSSPNFTQAKIWLSSGKWQEGWLEVTKCLQKFPPQKVSTESELTFIQIILNSTQQHDVWIERITKLCGLFNGVNALNYLGEGLVRSLKFTEIEQATSDLLDRWQSAWHQAGDQYDALSLSLRLFDVGIEYLKTREPNALLGLPIEQRAILEQLFHIHVTYDER